MTKYFYFISALIHLTKKVLMVLVFIRNKTKIVTNNNNNKKKMKNAAQII